MKLQPGDIVRTKFGEFAMVAHVIYPEYIEDIAWFRSDEPVIYLIRADKTTFIEPKSNIEDVCGEDTISLCAHCPFEWYCYEVPDEVEVVHVTGYVPDDEFTDEMKELMDSCPF